MCRDFPIWCRVADRWASLHSVAQISLVCFEFLCRDRKLGKHRSLRVFFSCRVVYTCFSLFVQQIVSIRLLFCFEFGAEIQNSKFLFWNLIKELLATLRYRNIFLLSWYPIEKKTNKKTGEKKNGDGENVVILITDDQHVFIGADSALSSRLFCRQIFIVKTRRYI